MLCFAVDILYVPQTYRALICVSTETFSCAPQSGRKAVSERRVRGRAYGELVRRDEWLFFTLELNVAFLLHDATAVSSL
jgi:hypothetical protein